MNQNYDEIIRQMMKEINALKEEQNRLAAQTHLFTILNVNTPAQITANQNDYDPGDYDLLRLSTDASRNITGISGGVTGRALYLVNSGSFNIVLVHASALSQSANRFSNPGGVNHTMTPTATGTRSRALLIYTGTGWALMFESAP
jgi:hypothetical protein